MSILITGANGLLGKALISEFSGARDHLYLLTQNDSSELKRFGDVIKKDISKSGFTRGLPVGIDTIYHLVQSRNYKNFPLRANEVFRTNVLSTQELLNFSARTSVSKFIYASSGGVYESGQFKFKEASPLKKPSDIDYYLATKLSSELLVQSYRGIFEHVILRYFFIYGKGQKREMLLPRIYDNICSSTPIVLSGENGLLFNPVNIKDASKLTKNARLVSGSRTINISGPKVYNLRGVAKLFGNYIGKKPIFEISTRENLSMVSDLTSMRDILGESKILLENSLEDIQPLQYKKLD